MSLDDFQRPYSPLIRAEDKPTRLLARLASSLRQARQHQLDRNALRLPAEDIVDVFSTLRAGSMDSKVRFSEGCGFVGGEYLRASAGTAELVSELLQHGYLRGLGGFEAVAEVSLDDALALLRLWREPMPEGRPEERLRASNQSLLEQRRALGLEGDGPLRLLSRVSIEELLADRSTTLPPASRKATLCYARLLARLRLALDERERTNAIASLAGIERVLIEIIEELDADVFRTRLLAWTGLRGLEWPLLHHNLASAIIALCAARELGFEPKRMLALSLSALLHDLPLGQKTHNHAPWAEPACLALAEAELSREKLFRVVLPREQISLHILDNPELAEGPAIFEAQLLAASCAFDRHWRDERLPASHALRAVANHQRFHKSAVSALVAALGVLPRGTVVRLEDASLGLVLENGRSRLHRPLLRVIQLFNGKKPAEPVFLDLLDPSAPRIESAVDERHLNLDSMEALIRGLGADSLGDSA